MKVFEKKNSIINNKKKKGKWSLAQDQLLKLAVQRYGLYHWKKIATLFLGQEKSSNDCRTRWYGWLDPTLKAQIAWSKQEEKRLIIFANFLARKNGIDNSNKDSPQIQFFFPKKKNKWRNDVSDSFLNFPFPAFTIRLPYRSKQNPFPASFSPMKISSFPAFLRNSGHRFEQKQFFPARSISSLSQVQKKKKWNDIIKDNVTKDITILKENNHNNFVFKKKKSPFFFLFFSFPWRFIQRNPRQCFFRSLFLQKLIPKAYQKKKKKKKKVHYQQG